MAAYRWKSFNDDGDRPEKPRRYGVTEMKGPNYSLFSRGLLEDVFESMGQFVDGLKLCDGSHTVMPKNYIKEVTDMAHKHNVYVSSGDWADQMLRRGPSSLKEYIEECKQLGFDSIELDVASLGLPEETLLRYLRLIKSNGLRAKPQFSVKFNKSDIAFAGDRAFGAYVIPAPQTSEMVEDVDLLVRRAERCLEAGADMIMINADDLCRQTGLLRSDIVAKIVGRLGLEKTMFEASNPKISEWFVKRYGPKVNLIVDHSQVMDLECLRGRNLGQNHSSVLGRSKGGGGEKKMPAVWFALKKSLQCRSEIKDVYDPRSDGRNLSKISTKKATAGRSGCSRSIANLKDVIHGSKRHMEKPPLQSPRSIGSSELLNPITHEVVLSNSTCELKITSCNFQDGNGSSTGNNVESISAFMGTLKPGTPGPGGHHIGSSRKYRGFGSPIRKGSPGNLSRKTGPGFGGVVSRPKASYGADSHGLTCHKCGEQFVKWEAVEAHHLSKHAVTELVEGDSSRKIVEIICRTSWSKPENSSNGIERILKVHNMQKVLAQFEEYRELVKIKASKLAKKHPRCLADGNELLRFFGATVECSLGMNSSSSLCTSEKCKVCRILQHGFSIKKEINGGVGVFTASTSGRALEAIEENDENILSWRKALIVCRVIAGRVHRPLENVQELIGQSGFDSLAGKVGLYSNIEELYLLSPKALLPCFVVICKS